MIDATNSEERLVREIAALRARVAELERAAEGRERAEAALRVMDERFSLAVAAGMVGVWEYNIQTREIYLSSNLKTMLGYAEAELPNTVESWIGLVHPEDMPRVQTAARELMEGRAETFEVEHRKIHKDGRALWIAGKGRVSRDAAGKPSRIVGSDSDITELKRAEAADRRLREAEEARAALEREVADRKKAEEELRASRSRLAEAQQLARLASWEMDLEDGKIRLTDERFRILGIAVGEFTFDFEAAVGFVVPEDREMARRAIDETRETGQLREAQIRVARPGSPMRWIHVRSRAVAEASGPARKLVGTAQDITEIKEAEDALRESESRFRMLADIAPVMIWTTGPDAKCTFVTNSWLRFTGRRLVDELGEGWMEGIHEEDRAACWKIYVAAAKEQAPFTMEFRLRRGDGEWRWILGSGVPRVGPGAEFLGYVGYSIDITERKRAEAELAASEERYRSVVGALEEGIVLQDEQGVIRACNSGAEEILGLSLEDLMARTAGGESWEALGPDGQPLPADRRPSSMSLKTGEPFSKVIVGALKPDGAVRWLSVNSQPLFKPGQHAPYAVVSSFSDVSERLDREREVRREREFSQNLIDSSLDGIHAFDRQCRITVWNPAMARFTGKSREEVLGRGVFEAFPFLREGGEEPYFLRALEGTASRVSDGAFRRDPDGPATYFERFYAPLRGASGEIEGGIAIVRDVTERRRHEETLRNMAEGVSASTGEAFFRSLALFLARTLKTDYALVGELLPKRPETIRTLAVCADGAIGENFEYRLEGTPCENVVKRDVCVIVEGAQRSYPNDALLAEMGVDSYFGAPLVDSAGKAQGLIAVMSRKPMPEFKVAESMLRIFASRASAELERIRAEHERRSLETQIQQAQKLESLGILAGGIAHDFNNLLVGILGNAGLALLDLPEGAPSRRPVEQIEKAGVRAAELVKQMLAYSGKGRFVIEAVDLSALVEEMAHLLEVSIGKSILLQFQFSAEPPVIEADATQIRQVVMNLITNASDAIGAQSGVINVSAGCVEARRAYLAGAFVGEDLPEGRYAFVEVADTGCGMDAETQAKIFDPFFTTKFTGRGLGLAAVLGIVRGHRGAIRVRSKPGEGTTIRALFPAAPAEARPEAPEAESEPEWRGGGEILVIDDEEPVRDVAAMMLERWGFRVEVACNGREGVEIYRRDPARFSAVLLDMTMPQMGGEEAFGEIRRIRPDARVILLSGYDQSDATTRFAGKGLAGFVQKPFRPEDLAAAVRRALESPAG